MVSVSVIGLGKLGASMAAAIASRGLNVIGVDINQRSVELVNSRQAPVHETDLQAYMEKAGSRLRATMDHTDAVLNSDLSFVIVPTPSDERGAFSLRYAMHAFREIGQALGKKSAYHVVVMTSTVLPGATRHGLAPVLEQASGKVCGRDFGLCYSPEFIALGSVIRDFLNPDFNLIGEYDADSGRLLEDIYSRVCLNNPPARRMSLENAEITKVALNTFVTTKITFANMLAEVCQRVPGADVDVVSDALGLDSRIGRKYLTGALGYGGPCFPRDNVALSFFSRAVGARADLAETTDRMNRSLAERIVDELRHDIPKSATVAVLGLSYKPASVVIEESQGVYLARALSKAGMRVLCHDPLANEAARTELQYDAVVLDSLDECLKQADAVIIANPDPIFRGLTEDNFKGGARVVDFWRLIAPAMTGSERVNYTAYGRDNGDPAHAAALKELWRPDL